MPDPTQPPPDPAGDVASAVQGIAGDFGAPTGLSPSDLNLVLQAQGVAPQTPQTDTTAAPAAAPVQKASASVSYKGLPKGVSADKEYQAAEDKADLRGSRADETRQQQLTDFHTDYGALAEAQRHEADVESAHFDIEKGLLAQQRAYDMAQSTLEEKASGEAQARSQEYLSAYQQQLAGVRALAAQSGNPLNSISAGNKIGLVGAMFAQGFLAARGIHIDVGGQIDRWVERGIQEHQMMVQNARESAGDTLHLYEVARQTSQDEWEARQRYRGFVLEGFKTSLQMEAARTGSQMAQARAQGIIAKAQLEQDTTASTLRDRWWKQDFEQRSQNIQATHYKLSDEIEMYKAQTDRARALALKKPAPNPLYIADPEKRVVIGPDGTRQTVQIRPKMVDPTLDVQDQYKAAKELNDAGAAEGDFQDKLTKLLDAREKLGNAFGTAQRLGRKLGADTPEWRNYDQARNNLINAEVYKNSGKQINESEFERFAALTPNDKMFQFGNSEQLIQNMRQIGRAEFQRKMDNPIYLDVPPTDPNRQHAVTEVEPGLAGLGRAQAAADSGAGTTPDAVTKDLQEAETEGPAMAKKASGAWKTLMGSDAQPLHTTFVEDIVKAAVKTQQYRREEGFGGRTQPSSGLDTQDGALSALDRLAREPTPSGTYARMWLHLLTENPKAVDELLK